MKSKLYINVFAVAVTLFAGMQLANAKLIGEQAGRLGVHQGTNRHLVTIIPGKPVANGMTRTYCMKTDGHWTKVIGWGWGCVYDRR